MGLTASLIVIALLIGASAFFSIAEISMAASRRMRLQQMADEGETRALRVMEVQEQPGNYFTVVQIGLNAVAILGGIVGEGALSPYFVQGLQLAGIAEPAAQSIGFVLAFLLVTSLFILFADLFPKRLGMIQPEQVAIRVVRPMQWWGLLLRPVVWVFNGLANVLFKLFGLPSQRDDRITHDDILALAEAGAQAGLLLEQEQQVIANVFELDVRTVESAMTPRDRIVYFLLGDDEEQIRTRIAAEPHSTYLVCDGHIDEVVGYVDAADLFQRVLQHQPLTLQRTEGLIKKVLIVPDRITLSEMLAQFRQAHEDFAVIVNEYSLVVGVITLNDVMSTVMGSLVGPDDEEQIVRRDDGSWLIDGVTPIVDVMRAIGVESLPHEGQYDTLAGFLMVMLRRIPRRTDSVVWGGFKFEVMDVDSFRIDQVMVTRLPTAEATPTGA
ncbi:hemolysin family protein [Caldimonas thermodepolymerans]|jgi:CBS domain containing-hemolysin-like protein|uniref:Polyamine export protein n=1 Tax=Caldimonas thermodepolymerans TaxID=215580 RepID=A0AA46DH25_9BURK|nr:hemolysin family protein [Caldimonas thermodepolymerans]TCP10015.1 CBS domain containing-hemolysin-like protein [Caldimonas thermodepolymerans]UZG42726.1 hemolysin family protein [Caldimonas thermodepolymerans]UZG46397.1 hemolysin family protein [Caldimonas thermodepolymerans]